MKKQTLAALAALTLFASCQAASSWLTRGLSPEVQQELDTYQNNIAVLENQIEVLEDQAEDLASQAAANVRDGEVKPLGKIMSDLLTAQEKHKIAVTKYESVVAKERQLLNEVLTDRTEGLLAVATPFLPPWSQPLVPFASTLAVLALSSRARKHTGKALAAVAKGNLGETLAYILKAAGAKHSNEDPAGVATGLEKVAKDALAKGDITVEQYNAVVDVKAKLS